MSEADPESYTIAIPGTEQTLVLSRQGVLDALARRELSPAHWVWSTKDEDWKPISQIPELQPKRSFLPPLQPGPTPPAATTTVPLGPVKLEPAELPPVVLHKEKEQPKKKKKKVKPRPSRDENREKIPFFQIIFGFLFLAVAGVIGLNYELVDKPLDGDLAKSPFVLTAVHAHLGNFVQPGRLVIHVLSVPGVDEKNLADFLFTVAKSTPEQPLNHQPFETVALTSAWNDEYVVSGADWHQLGQMDAASPEQRRNFLLDHVDDAARHPLVEDSKTLGMAELAAARTKAWQELVADLLPKH
jgi:hypothetical protein